MVTDYADHGQAIAEAFQKYLKTGDKQLIENYSARELKTAISRLSPFYNNNRQWYRVLEQRIQELQNIEEKRQQKAREQFKSLLQDKWMDRIIAFIAGLLAGVFLI